MIFFFPYNPPPPLPRKPPARPTPKRLISVHFGSVWLRFGSVWLCLAPFRVRFGSFWWGRGGVGEKGFCKGKEYHYPKSPPKSLCGSLFCVLLREMRHINLSGGLKWGLDAGRKFMLKNFTCFSCPLHEPKPNRTGATRHLSANKGHLGRGVCETKSKNGRSRPRKPFISRGLPETMGLGRGQTMG